MRLNYKLMAALSQITHHNNTSLFINFSIKNMLQQSCHQMTEQMAKKQRNSNNQKSNFKYLMNNKTNRSTKSNPISKENQIESVLMKSTHKYANYTPRINNPCQQTKAFPTVIYPFDVISFQSQKNQTEETISNKSSQTLKVFPSKKQLSNDQALAIESRANTEIQQKILIESSCMTEECYYGKQLQIKIQLLQKQRDDIWNSIATTIKENIELKKIIAQFIQKNNNKVSACLQTDCMASLSSQVQTELTAIDVLKTEQEVYKLKENIKQAKQFCLKMITVHEEEEQDLSDCFFDLKNHISQTLNKNIMKLTQTFQKQKIILLTIQEQEKAQLQQQITEKTSEIKKISEHLRESMNIKKNMEQIYLKQLEDLQLLIREKEEYFSIQIQQLDKQLKSSAQNYEKQNKQYFQYVNTATENWNQKQRMYSTLLTEAHKTIKSLIEQLRDFQSLASANYSLYLKSQKIYKLSKCSEPFS